MVVKERRTKILLLLFLLSDVNFEFLEINQDMQRVFDLTFNQKTRGTLSAMIREGIIEKPDNQNNKENSTPIENRYKLTQAGFYQLCLEFPFFRYLKDKWDGKWRILSYEIPEKKRELRDRLRRVVSGWGLGPWHRSFWLTPHPIIENLRQLVSQKEEEMYIQAFQSEHVFGNRDTLIEKVWQKSAKEKQYRELFKTWHDILSKEGDKVDKFTAVVNNYLNVLKLDPGLPPELVGQNWIGFESYNIFKEIRSILLQ